MTAIIWRDDFRKLSGGGLLTAKAAWGFCGEVHGEPGSMDTHVAIGYLGGTQVVYQCRCEAVMRHVRFILAHRHELAETLRRFGKLQAEDAERLLKEVCGSEVDHE